MEDSSTTDDDEEESDGSGVAGGETILESNGDLAPSEYSVNEETSGDSGEEEWQEVVENEDGEIQARAFQMVGSSLFDSQMSGRVGGDAESSKMSDPSTVPSNVASVLTSSPSTSGNDDNVKDDGAAVVVESADGAIERWSVQLAKLRELGFDNERECVDALEMLYAANVGCDAADEEVTVPQAVDVLLNKGQ